MNKTRHVLGLAVAIAMSLQFSLPAQSHAVDLLQNIGDFISLGANTVRELQTAIETAGSESRSTLETLSTEIQSIVDLLSDKYQDNLEVTVSSVDELTRKKLYELQNLLTTVNGLLQEDISLVGSEVRESLKTAAQEATLLANSLTENLKDVVVVAGNTAVYVVERTTFNIVFIVSIILLAIGLLIFACMIFTKKLPKNIAAKVVAFLFMFIYVGAFGCLVFVPTIRVYALSAVGGNVQKLAKSEKKPIVLSANPELVKIGETKKIEIRGVNFTAPGSKPRIFIGDVELDVQAYDDGKIVADVRRLSGSSDGSTIVKSADLSGRRAKAFRITRRDRKGKVLSARRVSSAPMAASKGEAVVIRSATDIRAVQRTTDAGPLVSGVRDRLVFPTIPRPSASDDSVKSGSYTLTVQYGDSVAGVKVVEVEVPLPPAKPADLTVLEVKFQPESPVEGKNFAVSIRIKNQGESPASNFMVEWKPSPDRMGQSEEVKVLRPGEERTVAFTASYDRHQVFQTVATVDPYNVVADGDRNNNTLVKDIVLQQKRYQVTVQFYKLYIINDQDGAFRGAGDIWVDFYVNREHMRFPESGNTGIDSGSYRDIWLEKTLVLTPDDSLTISSIATDDDSPDGNDSLGQIEKTYHETAQFGHGDRIEGNGNYKIYYRIRTVEL